MSFMIISDCLIGFITKKEKDTASPKSFRTVRWLKKVDTKMLRKADVQKCIILMELNTSR